MSKANHASLRRVQDGIEVQNLAARKVFHHHHPHLQQSTASAFRPHPSDVHDFFTSFSPQNVRQVADALVAPPCVCALEHLCCGAERKEVEYGHGSVDGY